MGVSRITTWPIALIALASTASTLACEGDVLRSRTPPAIEARRAEEFIASVALDVDLAAPSHVESLETIVLPALRDLGVRHLRDRLTLPVEDAQRDGIFADRRAVTAVGVVLTYWVSPPDHAITSDDILRAIDFSGGAVAAFEGPDDFDVAVRELSDGEVLSFVREMREALRAADAPSAVALIAPATRLGGYDVDFGPHVDLGNIHAFLEGLPASASFDRAREVAARSAPGRTYVVTAAHYHHGDGPDALSEVAGAKYILRMYLEHFRRGIVRTYLRALLGSPDYPGVGLLRPDGSPKRAFVAISNLLALLQGGSGGPHFPGALAYTVIAESDDVRDLLLQTVDGRFHLILWREVASFDREAGSDVAVLPSRTRVRLGGNAEVTITRPLEGREPVDEARGPVVEVEVSDDPLVLTVKL